MRITEEEMEIRRVRMIHVAYQLFNQHGIDGVSLEKIAIEAEVSPKSIFRYFKNKAQLVEETQVILWKEIVNCITSENQNTRLKAENGLEELEIILWGFETLYKNHSDYILFFYDYQSYLFRKHIQLSEVHLERILTDIRPVFLHALERGQKDFSIVTEESPTEQFLLIWAVVRSYLEYLVIYSQIYVGENPWIVMFPKLMEKVLKMFKA